MKRQLVSFLEQAKNRVSDIFDAMCSSHHCHLLNKNMRLIRADNKRM